MQKSILEYFPHDEIRPKQTQVAYLIEEFLADPAKKYLLLQAPVGMGKSALNLMASRASGSAYVATANKALQDQYIKSYGHLMADLKGRANYACDTYGAPYNCGNAPCRKSKKTKAICHKERECSFHRAFDAAAASPIASFNFASFLAYTEYFKGNFPRRELLVVDEAHNIPEFLSNHVGIKVSQRWLDRLGLGVKIPGSNDPEKFYDFLMTVKENIGYVVDDRGEDLSGKDEDDLETFYAKLTTLEAMVEETPGAMDNFVVVSDPQGRGFEFKPVSVSGPAERLLLRKADKHIFISATFLDFRTFYEQLGLPVEQVSVVRVGSSFPKENRPIYLSRAVGPLDYKNVLLGPNGEPQGPLLPDVVQEVREILALYPSSKGIIHCKPYALCRYIVEQLKDPRIIFPASAQDQKEALQRHERDPAPTVLISPSLTEGIDLKGYLSEFQILLKVPYPNTQDPIISRRRHLYPGYYLMKTAIEIVQAYGRSIRSETDRADTWVLDSRFRRMLKEDARQAPEDRVFPQWFTEAVIYD